MSENLLTHKALATLLGVSETTVKSYRRKFPGCIPVASEGKPIRFTKEAASVALKIRDLFETGMSVKEVRLRLAADFAWITAETPKIDQVEKEAADRGAPELTQGVSNMAKTMVTMTQQQQAIIKRMQVLEGFLSELGIKGTDAQSIKKANADAARLTEERLEKRLADLDAVTHGLASTVATLASDLSRFLGKRDKAAEEWRSSGGLAGLEDAPKNESGPVVRFTVNQDQRNGRRATDRVVTPSADETGQGGAVTEHDAPARVIPLRQNVAATPMQVTISAPVTQRENRQEPSRHFLSLPLVARTAQGNFASADGRSRSRYCLNDLKAMLIHGFSGATNYHLQWEAHGQGWWLHLTQPGAETGRTVGMLLMELPGRSEGSLVEILELQEDGEKVHPTAISRIIEGLTA